MPVVDEAGRLLGIVTVDDAMDVFEDDVEEGRSRWSWPQFLGTLVAFLILLVPYTILLLQIFGK